MTQPGEDKWSVPTRRTSAGVHPDDVSHARRSAAAFGGGGPGTATAMRSFVRRYGWRAYALPILVVVTLVALMTTHGNAEIRPVANGKTPDTQHAGALSTGTSASTPPVAPANLTVKSDTAGGSNVVRTAIAKAALPDGGPYTRAGDGTYRVIAGTSPVEGRYGRLYRYDVEVENGITGIATRRFASLVQTTLSDPRSWSGHGVRVERVDSGAIDFHVSLTSALTVRRYCGYSIPVETSCYVPAGTGDLTVNRVVLNVARWIRGAAPYVGDLGTYRVYMINHEDGHALGHMHAHQCLPGGLAPVMMQQTFGLKSAVTGQLCGANDWPFPPGVTGAPGAEQPDTAHNDEFNLLGSGD